MKNQLYISKYGEAYECNHPVYNRCTLYKSGKHGLAIIQQRFDPKTKTTWWSEIDPWLTDLIYLHPDFKEYFENRARQCTDGLYPTVTIRQIMWTFRLKPIPRERWETYFDRKDI